MTVREFIAHLIEICERYDYMMDGPLNIQDEDGVDFKINSVEYAGGEVYLVIEED